MEPFSFFGRFVQKLIVSCFLRFICSENERTIRWQLSCYKWFPAFIQIIQKTASSFLQTHMKNVLWIMNTVLLATTTRCFLPNCRCHIIPIGNIKWLLQKLNALCFNYQHVDCLYTLFVYRFTGKIVVKGEQLFDNVQRAVHFKHQNKGVDRMLSIAKKTLEKKVRKTLVELLPKPKLTGTSRSVFADGIEQVKKTKFELELITIVDYFLDGHVNYTSNLVSIILISL